MFLLTQNAAKNITAPRTWSIGAMAGLAGGLIEITWITIYQNLSGGDAAQVARGISTTLLPDLATPAAGLPIGIAIHMGLAIMLGIAVAIFVRAVLPRNAGFIFEAATVIGLLFVVWVVNFFLVLPAINPMFVTLVPHTVSLASKVFFGAVAALVLYRLDGPRSS